MPPAGPEYWICDACLDGPWSWALNSVCFNCNHSVCDSCTFYWADGRESGGPQSYVLPDAQLEVPESTEVDALPERDPWTGLAYSPDRYQTAPFETPSEHQAGPLGRTEAPVESGPADLLSPLLDPLAHYTEQEDVYDALVVVLKLQHVGIARQGNFQRSCSLASVRDCIDRFQALARGFEILRTYGLAVDKINLLVQIPPRRYPDLMGTDDLTLGLEKPEASGGQRSERSAGVAVVSELFLRDRLITSTITLLHRLAETDSSDPNDVRRVEGELQKLLDHLGIQSREECGSPACPLSESNSSSLVRHLSSVVYFVTAISLLSYARSHASQLDLPDCDDVTTFILTPRWLFRRKPLTCLDGFIGGPVWIMEDAEEGTDRYDLSITVDQFADLWGPLLPIEWRDSGLSFLALQTERGAIHAAFDLQSSSGLWGVPSHWCPDSDVPLSTRAGGNTMPPGFTGQYRMLIGRPPCQTTQAFHTVASCPWRPDTEGAKDAFHLKPANTWAARYEPDGFQVNVTTGQWITGTIVKQWRHIPKRTYKQSLLFWLVQGHEDPQPFLSLNVGVQISCCTRNAERISLWHLIQVVLASGLITCQHEANTDVEYCLLNCLKPHLPESLVSRYSDRVDRFKQVCIERALRRLQDTGVDSTGEIQAYWPFEQAPHTLPLAKDQETAYRWSPMLDDSPTVATFITMSGQCLSYADSDHSDCRSPCQPFGTCGSPRRRYCHMPSDGRSYRKRAIYRTTIAIAPSSVKSARMAAESGASNSDVALPQDKPLGPGARLRISNIGTLEICNYSPTRLGLFTAGILSDIQWRASRGSDNVHHELVNRAMSGGKTQPLFIM